MAIEIKAPTFPESVADGTVATWHKKPGDAVKRDELIVDIETDKVVPEVLATADGVLGDIVKGEGDTVLSDEVLGSIVEGGAAAAAPAAAPAAAAPAAAAADAGEEDRSPLQPLASWLKRTASIWLRLPAPVKVAASPRKTWLPPSPTRRPRLPPLRLPSLPLLLRQWSPPQAIAPKVCR